MSSATKITDFWSSVERVCYGRSFFSTESDRIGIGPPDIEAGDTSGSFTMASRHSLSALSVIVAKTSDF